MGLVSIKSCVALEYPQFLTLETGRMPDSIGRDAFSNHQGGTDMGNDSIIAFKTREQLRKHLGIFSPQFKGSRWKMEFLGQMLFGIQASRDTLMSEIARSLQEDILAKKTQERLERHLATDGMDAKIHGSILCDAAPGIGESALVIVDPTDVQKEYADKMPYLAKVWDGSKGRGGDNLGYTLCMVRLHREARRRPESAELGREIEGFPGSRAQSGGRLHHEVRGQRHVQVAQQGPQRPGEIRLYASEAAGTARRGPAPRRRQVARWGHAYPDFSGQLIPKSRQGPVNIGQKIFLGRSETGGDFFLSPVFRLFNAFPRRNRPVVAPQGGGKTRSAAP